MKSIFDGVIGAETSDLYLAPLNGSSLQVDDTDGLLVLVGNEDGTDSDGFHIQWLLQPDSFYVFHGSASGADGDMYELSIRSSTGANLSSVMLTPDQRSGNYATYMTTDGGNFRLQARRQGFDSSGGAWSLSPSLFRYDQPDQANELNTDVLLPDHTTSIIEAGNNNV